jgi:hypothetical protein
LTDNKKWVALASIASACISISLTACGGGSGGSGGGGGGGSGGVAVSASPAESATAQPVPASVADSSGSPVVGDCEMFPANAIFNTRIDDVSRFPVHPRSSEWVNVVGPNVPFTTDWGNSEDPSDLANYFGIPINVVDGTPATTQWPVVAFDFSPSGVISDVGYPDRSDCAVAGGAGFTIVRDCTSVPPNQRRFPFPNPGKVLNQGGDCNDPHTCGDHTVLVIEKGACRLWESYFPYNLSGQWYAMATAAWDLKSLSLRPDGWNSASASGLPITPLQAKASEAASGEIRHALRVNFSDAKLSLDWLWPARFGAGNDTSGSIPFGALLRLKASFVIPDNWNPQAKALATAAKRYGLYISDIGPDFYVTGEPSKAWDMSSFGQLRNIKMSDMEFVDLKAITSDPRFSPDSMQASW